ncbi:MAG: DinB family protein [Chloroflexota bacterium]|nr:DinB family protein [Chloroflexota bacterium]
MTRNISTLADIVTELARIQQAVVSLTDGMSQQQFFHETETRWSPAGYLKHLILSIKPVAKALALPPTRILSLFGAPAQPSRSYDQIVSAYSTRLAEGIRAEDYENVTPGFFRLPAGTTDEQRYLIDTWNDSNTRLITAAEAWAEADLDTHQLPHPAIGAVTVREMLYFTIYHNTLHWRDIEASTTV